MKNQIELTPYYKKNREKKLIYQKKYGIKTNYSYDKKPDRYSKQKIRWIIRNLFKSGKIKKERCEKCGIKKDLQFHHFDYNKIYNVSVLCKICHLKEHKKIGYKLPIKKSIKEVLNGKT